MPSSVRSSNVDAVRGGDRRSRAGRLACVVLLVTTAACTASPAARPAPDAAPSDAVRTLHVSPDGDDDATGGAEEPFETLQHALAQLRAGDELLVHDGTYEERVEVEASPGREEAPVQVRAAPGARPVLRGLLWLQAPTWWRVQGLNVTWDDDNDDDEHMVKMTDGTDWVLSDAEIWGARSYAAVLVAGDPERFALRRLHVHDTAPTNGDNEDHLLYLNSGRGPGVVEHCLLIGSPNGRAIKVGPASRKGDTVSDIVIRYNTMVDNRGPSNVQLAWDTRSVEIYRNIMVGAARGRENVTAYDLGGDDNVVRDNVGAGSAGVLEAEVDGMEDGGGNIMVDPDFRDVDGRSYVPTADAARDHGHTAEPDGE